MKSSATGGHIDPEPMHVHKYTLDNSLQRDHTAGYFLPPNYFFNKPMVTEIDHPFVTVLERATADYSELDARYEIERICRETAENYASKVCIQ